MIERRDASLRCDVSIGREAIQFCDTKEAGIRADGFGALRETQLAAATDSGSTHCSNAGRFGRQGL